MERVINECASAALWEISFQVFVVILFSMRNVDLDYLYIKVRILPKVRFLFSLKAIGLSIKEE